MSKIGWDDQGSDYSAWDRIRDERRAEFDARQKALAGGKFRVFLYEDETGKWFRDNLPGDILPEPGATYGLPGPGNE